MYVTRRGDQYVVLNARGEIVRRSDAQGNVLSAFGTRAAAEAWLRAKIDAEADGTEYALS